MSRVTFAIVASSLLLVVNGQVELKSFLGTCVNTGSSLDSCLLQLANKLKPYMKTGIPSLNIPKTDPMDIDKIAFQLKNPLGVVTVNSPKTLWKASPLTQSTQSERTRRRKLSPWTSLSQRPPPRVSIICRVSWVHLSWTRALPPPRTQPPSLAPPSPGCQDGCRRWQ